MSLSCKGCPGRSLQSTIAFLFILLGWGGVLPVRDGHGSLFLHPIQPNSPAYRSNPTHRTSKWTHPPRHLTANQIKASVLILVWHNTWCCFDNFQSKIIACVQSLLPVLRCPRASVDWWRHYRRWWQFQSLSAIRWYRLPQQIKWQAPMSSYWPLVVTMVLFHFFRNNDNKNSSVSRRLWPLMMADEH